MIGGLGCRASEVVMGIAEEIAAQHVIHLPTGYFSTTLWRVASRWSVDRHAQ